MSDSPYLWICERCHYRNSKLAERCSACLNSNPKRNNPSSAYRSIINQSNANKSNNVVRKPPISSAKPEKTRTKQPVAKIPDNQKSSKPRAIQQQSKSQPPPQTNQILAHFRRHIRNANTPFASRWSRTCEELPSDAKTVIKKSRNSYASLLSQCRKASSPFVDSEFPTNRSSLYRLHEDADPQYDRLITKWLRIAQIRFERSADDADDDDDDEHDKSPSSMKKCKLCLHGPGLKLTDFRQGKLGDCWLLSSLASLVHTYPEHLNILIPDPKLHPEECVYQIFLCLDGKWSPVIIDDYFPCDQNSRLVFTEAFGRQLFAMMIEKALAKHYSCYKALIRGHSIEGFTTLTGMPFERIIFNVNVPNSPKLQTELLNRLQSIIKENRYLVAASCSIEQQGLHKSHAYSVLDVCTVSNATQKLQAILLANPWGDQQLQGGLRYNHENFLRLLKQKSKRGLFWMSIRDFVNYFDHIDVCKYSRNWFTKRFEFRLPFTILDQRDFTVFELNCRRKSMLNFTLHQPIDRDLKLSYQLLLSLAIFKIWSDESLQLVDVSPNLTDKIVNYEILLGRGKYLVVIFGFNHWGLTSRLKEAPTMVMAFHSSRQVDVKPLNPDMHLIGDLLIQTVIAIGEEKSIEGTDCIGFRLHNFCAFIWMVENHGEDQWTMIRWKTDGSQNAFSLRSATESVDLIPPGCRQIIVMMAPESDKRNCNYHCTFTAQQLPPESKMAFMNLDSLKNHSNNDAEELSALFAPRSIQSDSIAERNRRNKFDFTKEPDGSRCIIC